MPLRRTRSSGRLTEALASAFPAVSLEAVAAEFAKTSASKEVNAKVAALSNSVREEAAVAVGIFRSAEMWLRIKTPSVSDGNNFGVDVQNYVITELQAMQKAVDAMVTTSKDYHWARAAGLDKLFAGESSETKKDSSESTEEKDGKPETKKTASSSTSSKSSAQPASADYKEYLVQVDVRQYQNCHSQLSEIRNAYIRAHLLFAKNLKRLTDPRGEGEDGRSGNVMSMF